MRKYIIIALVLLVTGVAVSIYIIPSASEVVSMKTSDMQAVDLGKVDIESEYNQGRRSYPIVAALADKRFAAGDKPAAVKLLEEYVAANPNDVSGMKKLAEMYQATGNMDGYNKELETIAKLAPTEENLRALSDIYNANKEYVKQTDVLAKILEVTKGEKPEAFVDLATMQVVIGDNDGALKTVQALKDKHPLYSNYAMTRIMVSVLAEKGEVDQAFAAAKEWMDKSGAPVPSPAAAPAPVGDGLNKSIAPQVGVGISAAAGDADPHPKELADLCNILHYSGHADKAVELVDQHPEMLDREPTLVLAYVNANITAGRSDHAYEVLKKIDDSGRMIAALYVPYLDLTIKREDEASAEAIANKIDVQNFTEELALQIIEVARADSAPKVLAILTNRFTDAKILADKPVLAAVIAILNNDKQQDAYIQAALNWNPPLTGSQKLALAESCARAKKTACFDAIVKQYPPLDQMTPSQVAEYAQLFIIADRPAELVDPVGKLTQVEHPAALVQLAYHRLAAAAGREDVMNPWLQQYGNTTPEAELAEMFYLANDRHHYDVSSDIAQRLYARDPSPMNRDMLALAYIGNGKYEKAMPLVREQMKEPGANDGLYLSTLSKLARTDANARKELADYAQAALTANRGDDRQQLNYAYIMINNGRRNEVLPFAKSNAATKGGEWKKMYLGLTQKPKYGTAAAPVHLSREHLIAMAQSPSISAANKRQIAFQLLHDGFKDDAINVFKDLAKDKGPDSQEVKDLLYMWGGKLNAEQLAWVQQRAATANAYDKQRWSDIVSNSVDDNSLMAYVSATPEALYNPSLRKKYFSIIARTGSRKNYDNAMRNWVVNTTDVPALLDYANVGQSFGYREAAINGYSRVLTLDPNNAKALSQMAALDFGKGKYTAASQNLNQYLAVEQQRPDPETNPAQAHFYKAELLKRQGDLAGANAEYQQVVNLTAHSGASTTDALSRMYTAEFHLGQQADAKAGFEQLLEQNPDDKGILADYMSILIEYKQLDDATRIANEYDKTSPYYKKGAELVGRSAHTAGIERLSNGRELKISFNEPIDGKSPFDMKDAKKLAWLESTQADYDSVTVSAKPGYVVRYVPTANEDFAVVAEAQPEYSPAVEAQRQQDLRLQMLYARIEQQSGQTDKANQRLVALQQYYPNDPQLLAYEASVESSNGHYDNADHLIARAQAVAPENEDLQLQHQLTLQAENTTPAQQSANFAKLDHEWRELGKNEEQITTLSSTVHTANGLEFGFTAQNDFADTKDIRRPRDGRIGDYDTTRQRGEIYAAANLGSGERLQGSLFANNDTLGGGGYFDFANPIGHTQLLAEYKRPYWDFIEAVYDHATRDRVGAKHYAMLTPTLSLGLEGSFNRYNIEGDDDVAETVLARANLIQQLQPMTSSQPYLGVGYGFDGEYRTQKPELRPDVGFGEYYALPVYTREVHALTGIYQDDWTPKTHALFIGGVAYDRINGGFSPLIEAHLDQDIATNWQVGARARYAQETNDTDNHELNVGADLLYKF